MIFLYYKEWLCTKVLYVSEPHQYIIKIKKKKFQVLVREKKIKYKKFRLLLLLIIKFNQESRETLFPLVFFFLPHLSFLQKRESAVREKVNGQMGAGQRHRRGCRPLVTVHKHVPQKVVSGRSQLGLYKNPFEEISSVVWDVRWQLWVRWLSGDFKDGSHRFKLGPRRLFS